MHSKARFSLHFHDPCSAKGDWKESAPDWISHITATQAKTGGILEVPVAGFQTKLQTLSVCPSSV